MEFVPWTRFARIVHRYGGNAGVCAMAIAQLTWRERLRDIEVSLSANTSKLYALGLSAAVRLSTLAHANESRDRRIWIDLGALLIWRAQAIRKRLAWCPSGQHGLYPGLQHHRFAPVPV